MNDQSFEKLQAVLSEALDQASRGKGQERHGLDIPFDEQPWKVISNNVGDGFVLGQAMKKLMELRVFSSSMEHAHNTHELQSAFKAWKREALGAIVYTAMAVIWKEEIELKKYMKTLPDPRQLVPKGNCE